MDGFVLGCTSLVFLAFIGTIASVYLVGRDRKRAVQRLDRVSRWAFAMAFGLLTVCVLVR